MADNSYLLTEAIGEVVKRMRRVKGGNNLEVPHYMYGHRLDINRQLTAKDGNKDLKYKKYPLVALRLNTDEEIDNGYNTANVDLVIVASTNLNYNSVERQQKVIKPVLIPLYNRLLLEIGNSGLFSWGEGGKVPKHTRRICYFWGIEGKEGVIANIFNDPLDAIEIRMKLKLSDKCIESYGRYFTAEFSKEFN